MIKVRLLIAAALVVASSPLTAEPPREAVPMLAVPFDDLDLTQPGGRAMLDDRLVVAARTVCRTVAVGSPFDQLARVRCERKALAVVRHQVMLAANEAQRRSLLARNEAAR